MDQVVYVVDDEANLREGICDVLESLLSVKTMAFHDGESFLEAEHWSENACLILDQRLPGLQGTEVLEQLEMRQVLIPTIIITGYAASLPPRTELPSQVLDVLSKPFAVADLVSAVRNVLEERQERG